MNTKTYTQAQRELNKHRAAIIKMVAESRGRMLAITEDACHEAGSESNSNLADILTRWADERQERKSNMSMLAPTVSDVMDRVTNLTLRGQIFKIVGLHAPNYTEVADLGQKWMDAIGNLLKVSNGSTFYVSGRTQAADGTMYYAPTHQATSFLLMVAEEKGDACKSKGVYNAESDIGEVLTLMHRFSGFQNPAYTVFYDAEHVYPGVVP